MLRAREGDERIVVAPHAEHVRGAVRQLANVLTLAPQAAWWKAQRVQGAKGSQNSEQPGYPTKSAAIHSQHKQESHDWITQLKNAM